MDHIYVILLICSLNISSNFKHEKGIKVIINWLSICEESILSLIQLISQVLKQDIDLEFSSFHPLLHWPKQKRKRGATQVELVAAWKPTNHRPPLGPALLVAPLLDLIGFDPIQISSKRPSQLAWFERIMGYKQLALIYCHSRSTAWCAKVEVSYLETRLRETNAHATLSCSTRLIWVMV